MGIGMIADFVTGGGYFARDRGQAADICAALKEGGRGTVASQDFEQFGGGFTGSIVESDGNSRPGISAAADRRGEPGTRRDANSVSQCSRGDDGSAADAHVSRHVGDVGHVERNRSLTCAAQYGKR